MKKVIVKCKLKNRDEFEKKLADIDMDFGPVYWQHERVYVPRNYKKRSSFPRLILRTEMKSVDRPAQYSMEMRRHIEDSGLDIVDVTKVSDYAEAANIILQLGFEMQGEVSRRRQEMVLGKGTKMYMDKVEGMAGTYAKIEAELDEKDKVEDVRKEILKTLKSLGQDAKTVVEETYTEERI
ncbi:MAG: CYTH domain-containing protein [Candidatus Saccharibacteria bacterium]|nr:CYTH domain-containing protein [Candidatus Saccharibacteria bacterium]